MGVLQMITHDHPVHQKLTMGMRKEQLVALFEFISKTSKFKDKIFWFERAIEWLNMTPPSSKERCTNTSPATYLTGDFNLWSNGSTHGETIFKLLFENYQAYLKTGEKRSATNSKRLLDRQAWSR